jgi:hypothetical protein
MRAAVLLRQRLMQQARYAPSAIICSGQTASLECRTTRRCSSAVASACKRGRLPISRALLPSGGEHAVGATTLYAAPGGAKPEVRATTLYAAWGGQTREMRNDPICGVAVRARAAGAPLDVRVDVLAERRAGETTEWALGSSGLRETRARGSEKRRLRAEEGLRGNDPIRGKAAGAGAGDGARVAPAVTGLGSTRSLALGGTTLARTWEPSVAEILAARFGPPTPEDWPGAAVAGWPRAAGAPSGIAAMPSGGCAQRPYTRSAGLGADGGGEPVGPVIRR